MNPNKMSIAVAMIILLGTLPNHPFRLLLFPARFIRASRSAVEHALGRQLTNKTAFGQFKHPISGEASGAFFVLFLKERKFSYYASDVYDRNQLGEAQWQGNLDALAIRAMRGGGRIVDAVKDTVSYIDGELKRRFEAAAEAKRRAEAARKHAKQATAALLEEISQRITFAGAKAQEIRRDFPEAAGDLVSPQLPTWQGNLEAARVSLAAGDVSKAAERAEQTRAAVETYLKAAVGHASGDADLKQLRQDMEAIKVHEHAAAAQAALVAARNFLAQVFFFWQQPIQLFIRLRNLPLRLVNSWVEFLTPNC